MSIARQTLEVIESQTVRVGRLMESGRSSSVDFAQIESQEAQDRYSLVHAEGDKQDNQLLRNLGRLSAMSVRTDSRNKHSAMKLIKLFISTLAAAAGLVSCSEAQQMQLETYTVEPITLSETVTATGTMESVTQVDVGPQVTGIIDRLYADYNDHVKKGQLLAELEKTLLDSELKSADAAMESARATYEFARRNYERDKALHGEKLISDLEFQTSRKDYDVARGEMFTEHDIRTAAKVCVPGQTLVDNLFSDGTDPIGRVVRFGQIPMTVIGVLDKKGYNTMGQDQDGMAPVPYTTVMKRVLAIDYLHGIQTSAADESQTNRTIGEITDILRSQHKLRADEDDNYTIRSMQELSEMISSTSQMMTVLLAAVAGISLLVGGIGIMNIMIVSVTERTREIGLRMSIGATGRDIMTQFLIGAIIISVTGGALGIMLGATATWMISLFARWPVSISASSVILSFAVCTAIGVLFGFYPAAKASNLDPIEAIRYE